MTRRRGALLLGFVVIAVAAVVMAVAIGPVAIGLGDTLLLLVRWAPRVNLANVDPSHAFIVEHVRLPRALAASLVGIALAVSGGVMQGVFRNPLADPYLLGIAGGATTGAALTIVLGGEALPHAVAFGAFLGGLLAVTIVYRIAATGAQGQLDTLTLVLAGVSLAALFAAFTGLLLSAATSEQVRRTVFWIMGGLGGTRWIHVQWLLLVVPLAALVCCIYARDLNALALGEEMATHLGIDAGRLERLLLGVTTLMTALAVASAGTIGFVGLIVPHLCRLVIGADHRWLLPASALVGASFLTLADSGARMIFAPTEVPVGIITALCGAPFFLYLLRRSRRRTHAPVPTLDPTRAS